jgi:gp16 family phage-associated protein
VTVAHTLKIEQVKTHLANAGISYAQWARENNVSKAAVYNVLLGRTKQLRGDAHKAAVLLGLKDGHLTDAKGFRPLSQTKRLKLVSGGRK